MYLYSFLSCFQKIQTNSKPPTGLFKLNKAQMALSLSSWLKQSKRQSCTAFFYQSFIFLCVFAAQEAGHFNAEMAPVEVKTKKGKESMQKDEHPKPQTTLEQLAKLPAVFKKDGTVTAGNASVSTSKPWLVEVSP